MQELKYWTRWVGVLPISILAGILISFPVHWVLYRTLSGGDNPFVTPYPVLPEKILSPFFTAYAVVWTGSKIAPSQKFVTASILALIWMILAGVLFTMAYFGIHFTNFRLTNIIGGLPVIMGIAGSIIAVYQVGNKISVTSQAINEDKQDFVEKKLTVNEENLENPVSPYKTDILNLVVLGVFVSCFYFVIVRYVFFSFLICFNIFTIIYSFKEKLFTTSIMKFNIIKDIVMIVILFFGLYNTKFGFYATAFYSILQIFEFVKHFTKKHVLSSRSMNK